MFLSNKNNSGIYYLYYSNPQTGKRNKISCKTKSITKAQLFLRNFQVKWELADENYSFLPKAPKTISIAESEKPIKEYLIRNVSANTVSHYSYTFKYLLEYFGKEKKLNKITFADSESFKEYLHNKRELNETTTNWYLRYLRQIVNIALKLGLYDECLLTEIAMLDIPETEPLVFDKKQVALMLSKFPIKLKYPVEFTLNTGLRISELVHLQIKDWDIEKNYISIRNKEDFTVKTKNIGRVPLNERAKEILQEVIYSKKEIPNIDKRIFLNNLNRSFNRNVLTMWFKDEIRKLGFDEKLHYHCLRATFITNLSNLGISHNKVMLLSRHSSFKTTLRYIRNTEQELFDAVNLLNERKVI